MPGRRIVRHSLTARRRAVGRAVTAAVALAASVLAVSVPAAAQTQTPPFSDTADAYYSQAVDALAADGIFDGTECAPGMLCPEDSIDRKTMAVWIVRTLDSEDPAEIPNSRFSDVASVSFHAPFIERMAQLGVTAGCGNGNFCPDGTVDRYQMAVFLTKAFDLEPGPRPRLHRRRRRRLVPPPGRRARRVRNHRRLQQRQVLPQQSHRARPNGPIPRQSHRNPRTTHNHAGLGFAIPLHRHPAQHHRRNRQQRSTPYHPR